MKKETAAEKRRKREASIRGMILREMIADVTSTQKGHAFQTGELRKHPKEPPWKCPDSFERELVAADHFDMEYYIRKEKPKQKVILQLHGGGYIAPLRNAYRRFSIMYSKCAGGAHVLTIDYRVAPEYPYPAALEDALVAYEWLLREKNYKAEDIVVAGDSAGGGLALCLVHYLKDHNRPLPAGIVAMSPWTDLALTGESYELNFEKDPLFGGTRDSMIYNCPYITKEEERTNPYVSPLYGDFTGFPPILFQVGDQEMLLSDTLEAAKKAREAGVKVKTSVYEGMFHVFQMGLHMIPESKAAWEEVGKFLNKLWK
ncbi:MAG: alpha/beta hydrolase [Lachnospiraceae bacterium]|nr:alpha/beta hydrolase [Lachnospiraceae bacterium]